MKDDDEELVRLTVKGWLSMRLNVDFADMNEIWLELQELVRRRALADGYPADGIPALVFEGGGQCAMVETEFSLKTQ